MQQVTLDDKLEVCSVARPQQCLDYKTLLYTAYIQHIPSLSLSDSKLGTEPGQFSWVITLHGERSALGACEIGGRGEKTASVSIITTCRVAIGGPCTCVVDKVWLTVTLCIYTTRKSYKSCGIAAQDHWQFLHGDR